MHKDIRFFLIVIGSAVIVLFAAFIIIAAVSWKKNVKEFDGQSRKMDTVEHEQKNILASDTLLMINDRKVFIEVPEKKSRGTFLVLHGWNFPADDWCNNTSLCEKIKKLGFYIVLPDMGKSVYQDVNYPETRVEWLVYPTRSWLSDTLIPYLQKEFGLFLETDSNYIVGLSTGARGVALVLLDYPDLFRGAAALSGDYDQVKMPGDNLMTGFYGAYAAYKERWKKIDNPVYRIKEYKTPMYLCHGTNDKVVPPEQTNEFYDSLIFYHPKLKIKINRPAAGHTYDYWDSEVDSIIGFFGINK